MLDSRLRGNDGCQELDVSAITVHATRGFKLPPRAAFAFTVTPASSAPSFPRRRESRSPGRFLFPVPSPEGRGSRLLRHCTGLGYGQPPFPRCGTTPSPPATVIPAQAGIQKSRPVLVPCTLPGGEGLPAVVPLHRARHWRDSRRHGHYHVRSAKYHAKIVLRQSFPVLEPAGSWILP